MTSAAFRNRRQVRVRVLSVRCSRRQFQEAGLGWTAPCMPDVVETRR